MQFLVLLNECKKENELLEMKLSNLENSHTNLLNLSEKLQEPLNKPLKQKTKPPEDNIQKVQSFQPITAPISAAVLPKTPTKQSINSLLISASPISSASSPNNSSLQNISFGNSPQSQNKTLSKSLNTNINNMMHSMGQYTDFYKLNGIKTNNNNMNYSNNLIESDISSRYGSSLHQNNSQGHNQHITSALVIFNF